MCMLDMSLAQKISLEYLMVFLGFIHIVRKKYFCRNGRGRSFDGCYVSMGFDRIEVSFAIQLGFKRKEENDQVYIVMIF